MARSWSCVAALAGSPDAELAYSVWESFAHWAVAPADSKLAPAALDTTPCVPPASGGAAALDTAHTQLISMARLGSLARLSELHRVHAAATVQGSTISRGLDVMFHEPPNARIVRQERTQCQ